MDKDLNMPKISVITVVYNDVNNIAQTIESYLAQTWVNKEYIIIDGKSTDGTVSIIEKYSDQIDFWCSEPDEGMYDALNKGISRAIGDWIIVLNSGDYFAGKDSLSKAMTFCELNGIDVLYGDSIKIEGERAIEVIASDNVKELSFHPIFRHGSSIIRSVVQKNNLFDISKKSFLGYALDWELLHRLYKAGYTFKKVDVFIECYRQEGMSNHRYKNLWYNYLITSEGTCKLLFLFRFIKDIIIVTIREFIDGLKREKM